MLFFTGKCITLHTSPTLDLSQKAKKRCIASPKLLTYRQLWNSPCPVVEHLLYCLVSPPFHVDMSYLPHWMPSLGAQALCLQPPSISYRAERGGLCLRALSMITRRGYPRPHPTPGLLCPHLGLSQSEQLSIVWKILRDT